MLFTVTVVFIGALKQNAVTSFAGQLRTPSYCQRTSEFVTALTLD